MSGKIDTEKIVIEFNVEHFKELLQADIQNIDTRYLEHKQIKTIIKENKISSEFEEITKDYIAKLAKKGKIVIDLDIDSFSYESVKKMIKRKELKSFEYMKSGIFRGNESYYYVEKGKLVSFHDKNKPQFMKCLPKILLKYYDSEILPYELAYEINSKKIIDTEKKLINTFPLQRFDKNKLEDVKSNSEWVQFALKFLKSRCCNNQDNLFEWLCDYGSYLVRNKRTEVIPYLYGDEGLGKSLTILMFRSLIGENRCCKANMKKFASEFSSFKENAQLIYVEETVDLKKQPGAFIGESLSNMKDNCTTEEIEIRALYQKERYVSNFSNIIMSSNYLLNSKDMSGRRFIILPYENELKFGMCENQIDEIKQANADDFEKFGQGIKNKKNMKELFKFFYERKINLKNLQIETQFKTDLKEDYIPSAITYVQYLLSTNALNEKMMNKEFYDQYTLYCEKNKLPVAGKALFKHDITSIHGVEADKKDSKGNRYYKFNKIDELVKNWKIEQVQEPNDVVDELMDDMSETKELKATIESQQQIIDKQTGEIEKLKQMIEEMKNNHDANKQEEKPKPKTPKKKETEKPKAKKPKVTQQQILNEINTLLGSDSDSDSE